MRTSTHFTQRPQVRPAEARASCSRCILVSVRRAYDADRHQESFDGRLGRLVRGQYGVFSREQALSLGATRSLMQRRVQYGRWEEPYSGVYRIAGTPRTRRQTLLVACMFWGTGACVSGRSAGWLWQLTETLIDQTEIIVPRGRKRTHHDHIIHRCNLDPSDITVVDAIPVTTPARTIIDLAGLVSKELLEEALDEAIRRGRTTPAQVRWLLFRTSPRGRQGIGTLRSLLDARRRSADVPASPLETRLLRAMMRGGLPKPELQHEVRDGHRLVAIVDFAFPALKIAIEADGYRWHSGRARWQHDLNRRNKLTALGWRVIHITWNDLETSPDEVVSSVQRIIESQR